MTCHKLDEELKSHKVKPFMHMYNPLKPESPKNLTR